jgi:hypothetical protein
MSTREALEYRIERDYEGRVAHARSLFHMAIDAAEAELDAALDKAERIRFAELAELRHQQHKKLTKS